MVRKAQRGTLLNMSPARLEDRLLALDAEIDHVRYGMKRVGKKTKEHKRRQARIKVIRQERFKTHWAIRQVARKRRNR